MDAAKTVVRDFQIALDLMKNKKGIGNKVIDANVRLAQARIAGTDWYEINELIESAKSNI